MTAGDNNSPVTSFTSLDFDSVNADLVAYAQSRFPNSMWTDFNESNPGTHLIELLAYATDLLAYNLNASVNEAIPASTVREQNFRNLLKSFDYSMSNATPSTTTLTFTLSSTPGLYPFTISSHLQVASSSGIIFQPDSDTAVAAPVAGNMISVSATNGSEVYNEIVGYSTGAPSQSFALGQASVIDGTLTLLVGSTSYSQVDNIIEAAPTDTIYTASIDENGITTLTFGDGIDGIIPPNGQQIIATYKVGGGLNTNLPIGSITLIQGQTDGGTTPLALLSVTNTVAATNGGPKQTLANAKANLPLSLKANDRAVTFGDYAAEAVALVPGVLKANAIAGQYIGGTTSILLLIVPSGGGAPSPTLANVVINTLKPIKLAGKRIVVGSPVYVNLYFNVNVYVQSSAVAAVVASRVLNSLLLKYEIDAVDFADTFQLQDAYDSLTPALVEGLDHVFFNQFTVLSYFARHVDSPTIGTGQVIGITTSATVQRREWFIQVINAIPGFTCTMYTVIQRILGTITTVTDTLLTDQSAAFIANGLVGLSVHPRPQQIATTIPIIGNTTTSITVASGLLAVAAAGDDYAVEYSEPMYGKIISMSPSANVAVSATVIPLSSTANWTVGDTVYFVDGVSSQASVITSIITNTSITIATPLTFPLYTATSVLYFQWISADGTTRFAVQNDPVGTAFSPGDSFYVDTFGLANDITLRDENYPQLLSSNVVLNTIGGVS